MIDLGKLAVMAEAVPVTLETVGGAYNAAGKWVKTEPVQTTIQATIQSTDGSQLRDMPEGIRSEARSLLWSSSVVATGDVVIYKGQRYRAIYIWERPEGGFTRAALGLAK